MAKDIPSKKYTGVVYRELQDKSRTYYIIYKDPTKKDKNGKSKTERLKIGNSQKEGINEQYAHNKRAELLSKLRLGEDTNLPILKAKQHKTTIHDLALYYFNDIKATDGETRSYKTRWGTYEKHIKPFCGDLAFIHLNKDTAKELQKKLKGMNYAPKTINGVIELLSTIINFNIKHDQLKERNPLYGFKTLSVDNKRERFLSKEEIKLLLSKTIDDKVLHLFTLLALSTGARLEGLLSMQKQDINFNAGTIDLNDLKSGGRYKGFIKEDVKELLCEAVAGLKPTDHIISYENGKKTDAKRIQRRLKPILDTLFNQGVTDPLNQVVIHTFRHTFASHLAMNDVSIYKIMKYMNHKDIKMTMRYAKLASDSMHNDINDLF